MQCTIANNISDEKVLVDWLCNPPKGYEVKEFLPKIHGEESLEKLILSSIPRIYKKYVIDEMSIDALKALMPKIKKDKDFLGKDQEDTLEYIKEKIADVSNSKEIVSKVRKVYENLIRSTIDETVNKKPNAAFWDIAIWEKYPHNKGYPDLWEYLEDELEKEGFSDTPFRTYLNKASSSGESARDFRNLLFTTLTAAGYDSINNPSYMYITGNKKVSMLNKLRIWKQDSERPQEVNAPSLEGQNQEDDNDED